MKVLYIRLVILGCIISILSGSLIMMYLVNGGNNEYKSKGPGAAPDMNAGPQMMISTYVNNETNNVTFNIYSFNIMDPSEAMFYINGSWSDELIIINEEKLQVHFDILGNISLKFWVTDGIMDRSPIRTLYIDLSRHENMLPIPISTDRSLSYSFGQQPVMFNGEGSFDPDGSIIGYYWDFGDGTHSDTSQGINGFLPSKVVAHSYDKTGLYTAKLYVMDNEEHVSPYPYEVDINIKAG